MNRVEKLVTAAVLLVNLSVGFTLVARSDYSALIDPAPGAEAPVTALVPEVDAAVSAADPTRGIELARASERR